MKQARANDVAAQSEVDALRSELAMLREEFATWRAEIDEQIEDIECNALVREYRRSPRTESFPSSVVERMLNGETALAVYRDYRGLTQAQLADLVGTSASYISQIETGHREAGRGLRKRLSETLKIEEKYLFD